MEYRIVERASGFLIQVRGKKYKGLWPFGKYVDVWVRADIHGRPHYLMHSAALYMMQFLDEFPDLESAQRKVEKFKKGPVIHEC